MIKIINGKIPSMQIQHNRTFFPKRVEGTREFKKWQFRQEREKRKVQTSKDGLFFDWNEVEELRNKGRSHSIISELYYAANKARIEINYDKRTKLIAVWDN
jgi:Trm5-related predicted tRNA methylase